MKDRQLVLPSLVTYSISEHLEVASAAALGCNATLPRTRLNKVLLGTPPAGRFLGTLSRSAPLDVPVRIPVTVPFKGGSLN